MILADVAHGRAGDKGTIINVSVILFDARHFDWLRAVLTPGAVGAYLANVAEGDVTRYELPHLAAFNFVFTRKRGETVTRTLHLDAHGKALSSLLLAMPLPDPPHVA